MNMNIYYNMNMNMNMNMNLYNIRVRITIVSENVYKWIILNKIITQLSYIKTHNMYTV